MQPLAPCIPHSRPPKPRTCSQVVLPRRLTRAHAPQLHARRVHGRVVQQVQVGGEEALAARLHERLQH